MGGPDVSKLVEEYEEALREARRDRSRLHALFFHAPAAIAICPLIDDELVFEFANPAYEKLIDQTHLVGKKTADVFPNWKDSNPDLYRFVYEVARHGKRWITNESPISLDWDRSGKLSKRYFNVLYEPLRDEHERPCGIMTFAYDVTEQALARQSLHTSESELLSVLENMNDAFCALGADWKVRRVNSQFEELFGKNKKDMLDQVFWRLLPGRELERAFTDFRFVAENQTSLLFEAYFEHQKKWLTVNAIPTGSGGIAAFFRNVTQQKHAELKLRESEERFRTYMEAMPQMAFVADAAGNITYRNQRLLEYVGAKRDLDAAGWRELVLIHPEDHEVAYSAWARSITSGSPCETEFRLRRYDGVYRWFLARSVPFRNPQGHVMQWLGTLMDINDQKLAQIEYEKSVDASPAILWISDVEGCYTYLSKQWLEMTGQSPRTGIPYGSDLVHPDDRVAAQAAFQRASADRQAFYTEYRLRHRSGDYRWSIDAANPRFDSQKRFLGYAGSVFDIHEQKMANQALKKSEATLQTLVAETPVGLLLAEAPSGNILIINDELPKILRRDEISGAELSDFRFFGGQTLDGRPLSPEEWPVARAVKRGETTKGAMLRILRGDRSYGVVRVNAAPIFDEEARVIAAVGTVTDVTDMVEAQENLSAAVNVRDEFLSIASHELKTPITSLKLQMQLMDRKLKQSLQKPLAPDAMPKFLEVSLKQVDRLVSLIDDLLDVSRIQAGKLVYAFETVNISEIMEEIVERFSYAILESGSRIECSIPKAVFVTCDHFRIEQVVVNLLSNAVKYGNGSCIQFGLSEDADSVTIQVADHGMGIAKEKLDTVFLRFERAVSHGKISGLGLGLYIAKQIVEAHGGRIELDSELGRGSTFRVKIPKQRAL